MIRQQLVEKLREIPTIRQVEGAAQMRNLEDMRRGTVVLPAAFVIHSGQRRVGENLHQNDAASGIKTELIRDNYAITVICGNYVDSYGNDSSDVMDTLLEEILNKLQGWLPGDSDCVTSFSYDRGNIVGLYDDALVWVEEYFYEKSIRHQIKI